MKVGVVCPYAFDAHGGVQDQVARIVGWLRAAGHDAWAVAPGTGGPDGTRHVGGYRSIPANRSRAPISMNPRVGRLVREAVEDADVVHVHEPFMPFVSLGAVLADTPPTVGTFHADPGRIARATYRAAGPLVRRVIRHLDAVTAVSAVAATPLARYVQPVIVPNGIDLETYRPSGVARIAGRVVFIGRDDPRKGLDVLLRAWRQVRAAVPGAELVVVGTSRPATIPGVSFVGRVDEVSKAQHLASAEVLVAPNLGGESFGIVVLEGLASGCAVVASDLEAFRAVAGNAAAYSPAGDSETLAETVVALLQDDVRSRELSSAGVARSEDFGRERVLGGYLEAYATALARA